MVINTDQDQFACEPDTGVVNPSEENVKNFMTNIIVDDIFYNNSIQRVSI